MAENIKIFLNYKERVIFLIFLSFRTMGNRGLRLGTNRQPKLQLSHGELENSKKIEKNLDFY